MRRKRLRAALLLVVTAALGGIGYLVSRTVAARRVDVLRELGADFLPQVAQRIQNFRRVKVEKGRTVWEITAQDAQYYEATNEIVVREPRLVLFLTDGEGECRVAGTEGRLTLDGRELRALTLRGRVDVRIDDMQLETAEATYDRASDLITSADLVTIRGRSLEVHGRGMEISVGPQQVRLLDDVHTTVRADAASS
jgi:LPS export ABC transporter protein LptC